MTPRPRIRDAATYLLGVAGLAAALTSLWLAMRAVMNIGGACASGGPYAITVECPPGVDVLLLLSVPLGIACVAVVAWKGLALGPGYAGIAALAWPALFLSLGWNFLEYAFRPPDGSGEIIWGWLIPGIVFIVMGGIPLLAWFAARGQGRIVPGVPGTETPVGPVELRRAVLEAARQAGRPQTGRPRAGRSVAPRPDAEPPHPEAFTMPGSVTAGTLAGTLERLEALHRRDAIDDAQYEEAKRVVIAAAARGELG